MFASEIVAKAAPVNFKILIRDVNAIRAASFAGEPLNEIPKGSVQDATDCPIARALKNGLEVDVDADEIYLYVDKDHEQHDFEAIQKALRRAGFKNVKVTKDEIWDDLAGYGGHGGYVSRPNGVRFPTTRTMRNFIRRFDIGDFQALIDGSAF